MLIIHFHFYVNLAAAAAAERQPFKQPARHIFMCCNGSVIYTDSRRGVNPTVQQGVKKKNITACLDWLASGSGSVIGSFNSTPLSGVTGIVCQSSAPTELPRPQRGQVEVGENVKMHATRLGYCCAHFHIMKAAAMSGGRVLCIFQGDLGGLSTQWGFFPL